MNTERRRRELQTEIDRNRAELSALEDGTWSHLALDNHGAGITPKELARAVDISLPAANERLKRLWRVGLVNREREGVVGGGVHYRYQLVDP